VTAAETNKMTKQIKSLKIERDQLSKDLLIKTQQTLAAEERGERLDREVALGLGLGLGLGLERRD